MLSADQYELARYLWSRGKKIDDIARVCHTTYHVIANNVYNNRSDFPNRYKKVTRDVRESMERMRSDGMTQKQIAIATGYSLTTVRRQLRGYEVRYE